MKRMTNAELHVVYTHINKRFFGGRLWNGATVEFAPTGVNEGVYTIETRAIQIDENLRCNPNMVGVALLHEMVHAEMPEHISNSVTPGHGMRFSHRIVELFNQGAYDALL